MRTYPIATDVRVLSGGAVQGANQFAGMATSESPKRTLRLAIVGDVHDDWDKEADARALQVLQPDLVLFTGDFGDENVAVVAAISRLDFPKAAILGNHDCWRTTGVLNSKSELAIPIRAQLDFLGKSHVGYGRADFPSLGLSVVGGRPGSGGGPHISSSSLAKRFYKVENMKESSNRIVKQALAAPEGNSLILLAHNGPLGLGSTASDICGKDWSTGGGDHGDPDLALAIAHLKTKGKRRVPLVVFGHMHKELQQGLGDRKMIVVGEDKSVYLNAAVVPRIRPAKGGGSQPQPWERNFTLVDLVDGEAKKIHEVWVRVAESDARIGTKTLLYSSD